MQGAMALATILIARRFGSAGFGNYAFIASLVLIGNMLTTFGSDMLLISDIAARKDAAFFQRFFCNCCSRLC
jgi:O-antigen/teichoic acid export membrane protein